MPAVARWRRQADSLRLPDSGNEPLKDLPEDAFLLVSIIGIGSVCPRRTGDPKRADAALVLRAEMPRLVRQLFEIILDEWIVDPARPSLARFTLEPVPPQLDESCISRYLEDPFFGRSKRLGRTLEFSHFPIPELGHVRIMLHAVSHRNDARTLRIPVLR